MHQALATCDVAGSAKLCEELARKEGVIAAYAYLKKQLPSPKDKASRKAVTVVPLRWPTKISARRQARRPASQLGPQASASKEGRGPTYRECALQGGAVNVRDSAIDRSLLLVPKGMRLVEDANEDHNITTPEEYHSPLLRPLSVRLHQEEMMAEMAKEKIAEEMNWVVHHRTPDDFSVYIVVWFVTLIDKKKQTPLWVAP